MYQIQFQLDIGLKTQVLIVTFQILFFGIQTGPQQVVRRLALEAAMKLASIPIGEATTHPTKLPSCHPQTKECHNYHTALLEGTHHRNSQQLALL